VLGRTDCLALDNARILLVNPHVPNIVPRIFLLLKAQEPGASEAVTAVVSHGKRMANSNRPLKSTGLVHGFYQEKHVQKPLTFPYGDFSK
jgi:hypothetical protein